MAHYATLDEYRFKDNLNDIRGAKLYGEGGQELGRIRDVVFEHNTGDIRFLVIEYGRARRVLVPVSRVFRTVLDEDSFSSDLTRADLDRLPAFDEKLLNNDRQWKDYEKLHRSAIADIGKQAAAEYKRGWRDDPVQHMEEDAAHIMTPSEPAADSNAGSIHREAPDDYLPELWPQRLAPVFGPAEQSSSKLNMVPKGTGSSGEAVDYITGGFSSKWNGFAQQIRRDLHTIRGRCPRCEEQDSRAA